MRQLTQDREALRDSWDKRSKQLKQCSELQQFLRDAEQVDSATGAQEAFLSNDDLGVSLYMYLCVCIGRKQTLFWLLFTTFIEFTR